MPMVRRPASRVRRTRRGFQVRLSREERDALRSLPGQLRELLERDDPSAGRLFPPAYGADAERNAEYEALVHDDLLAERLSSLRVMEETMDASNLTEDQMADWLGTLNSLRLVLGTRLDVTEDMDPSDLREGDPDAALLALYYYLGWLEEEVVRAMAQGLDPAGSGTED
jgi:hypothetical protein